MERSEPRGERKRGPLPELSLDVLSPPSLTLTGRQQHWLTRGPGWRTQRPVRAQHARHKATAARTLPTDGFLSYSDTWWTLIGQDHTSGHLV